MQTKHLYIRNVYTHTQHILYTVHAVIYFDMDPAICLSSAIVYEQQKS